MSTHQLVRFALTGSIFLLMLGLGLKTRAEEATYLFRHPGLLLRSVGAMNVVMPVFVIAALLWIPLPVPIRVALAAIAVSPVPPMLPAKQERAGGRSSYAVGLLVAAAALSVVILPVSMELIGRIFGRAVRVPWTRIVPVLLVTVLLPLAVGVALRSGLPRLSARIAKPVTLLATVLLVLAAIPLVTSAWPLMRGQIGQGVLIVLVLFSAIGLTAGHALGGPDPDQRTVLALATAARHPGIAITLATLNFPTERAVPAVVMLHLIVAAAASLPYVLLRKRAHAAAGGS